MRKYSIFLLAPLLLLAACKQEQLPTLPTPVCYAEMPGDSLGQAPPWGFEYRMADEHIYVTPIAHPSDSNIFIFTYVYQDTATRQFSQGGMYQYNFQTGNCTLITNQVDNYGSKEDISKTDWIAFNNIHGLCVIRIDGTGYRPLGANSFIYRWNATDDTLFFKTTDYKWKYATYVAGLWQIGGELPGEPRYQSPDGSLQYYAKVIDTSGTAAWYVLDRAGNGVAFAPFTGGIPAPGVPEMTADHRYLLWRTDEYDVNGYYYNYRMNLQTNEVETLRKTFYTDVYGVFSPMADCKRIVTDRMYQKLVGNWQVGTYLEMYTFDINGCNETRLLLDVHR